MNKKRQLPRLSHLLLVVALLATLGVGVFASLGCESCAEEGEYCTDLDCCDDLACRFDQTAGYRCR